MEVRELGEFGLIERLAKFLGRPKDDRLIVGIGDDAAVWRTGDSYAIATTDTLVENVHFIPGRVPWRAVGWKALAVNVSDIAAMGGTPTFALVTLALPAAMPVDHLDALYEGIADCADTYDISVAGGDIVSSPFFSVTVALQGDATASTDGEPLVLRRTAAKPGDLVAVTGPLGGPAGALRALQERKEKQHPALVESHLRFWPRIDAGKIAVAVGIRCGIDISDGLLQDLGHICEASGVGADLRLDRVPIDNNLRLAYRDEAAMMATTGGEDYELILVGREGAIETAEAALRRHLEMPDTEQLTVVGEIIAGPRRVGLLDAAGAEIDVARTGWDHLKDARL